MSRFFSSITFVFIVFMTFATMLIGSAAMGQDTCAVPGDYYSTPTSGLAVVTMDMVNISQAFLSDGVTPVPLAVETSPITGGMEISVPWSEASASPPAAFEFEDYVCPDGPPQVVHVTLWHTHSATLIARDPAGAIVDTFSASDAQQTLQTLTVSSANGVKSIEIEGAELHITRICWDCSMEDGDTDGGDDSGYSCFEVGEYYNSVQTGMSEAGMGPLTVRPASLSDGTVATLSIVADPSVDIYELSVPWSEASASPKARIDVNQDYCSGGWPTHMLVYLRHGNACTLIALDGNGVVVDTETAGGAEMTNSVLTLNSPQTGIASVLIEGSEILISKICVKCGDEGSGDGGEPDPEEGVCINPGEYYDSGATGLNHVQLDGVALHAGNLPDGEAVPLSVIDDDLTGEPAVFVPWSESTANPMASMTFDYSLCGTKLPEAVTISLHHSHSCILYAYDASNNLVDTETVTAQGVLTDVTLESDTGVNMVLIEGAEIVITRICYLCENPGDGEPEPVDGYRYYLPYMINDGGFWTGLGVTNVSAGQAQVATRIFNADGSEAAALRVDSSIPAGGQTAFEIGSDVETVGWTLVQSDQPLAGVSFFGTRLPNNYMADVPFVHALRTELIVPHVAQYDQWDTHVMVCNPNLTATNVTLTFVDANGAAGASHTMNLPAMGSGTVSLQTILGSTDAYNGSLRIQAGAGVAAFALYNNLKNGGYSYAGIAAVDPADQPAPVQSGVDDPDDDSPF